MKTVQRTSSVVLVAWLAAGCAGPAVPPVTPGADAIPVDLTVAADAHRPRAGGTHGKGQGVLYGMGVGAAGCVMVGAEIDSLIGPEGAAAGTALGVLFAPACALVGAITGGAKARPAEETERNELRAAELIRTLVWPEPFLALVRESVADDPMLVPGHVTGAVAALPEVAADRDCAKDDPSSRASTSVAALTAVEPARSGGAGTDSSTSAAENGGEVTVAEAVRAGAEATVAAPEPTSEPADPVVGDGPRVDVRIEWVGLSGGGVDPPLRLAVRGHLCLRRPGDSGGRALGAFAVSSPAYRIDQWANESEYKFEAHGRTMAHALATLIHERLVTPRAGDARCRWRARPAHAGEGNHDARRSDDRYRPQSRPTRDPGGGDAKRDEYRSDATSDDAENGADAASRMTARR